MALENISDDELQRLESALLERVTEHGGSAGNTTLLRELKWPEEQYWTIRDRLVDNAKLALGKGKGGSVRIVPPSSPAPQPKVPPETQATQVEAPRVREAELYEPVAETLRIRWAKDMRYREFAVEITARQGKRETGGTWTRPDLTIAAMTTFIYVPGKVFEVVTFEVKPADALDVTAVYEALAHRRAATRAYVWLHVPDEKYRALVDTIVEEAKRHGVGVIAASDPGNYDTWEELVEAVRFEPDPEKLNDFITVQFSASNKDELLKWMR